MKKMDFHIPLYGIDVRLVQLDKNDDAKQIKSPLPQGRGLKHMKYNGCGKFRFFGYVNIDEDDLRDE